MLKNGIQFKRRIRTDARPAAKGLRNARQSGTSNEEPTPYVYTYHHVGDASGSIPVGIYRHTRRHLQLLHSRLCQKKLRSS